MPHYRGGCGIKDIVQVSLEKKSTKENTLVANDMSQPPSYIQTQTQSI